ncbi:hypothetical protein MMC19_002153 [Ptychographa xylographoides]|nr:hypothetical protein [Ptychographa xylographoides]
MRTSFVSILALASSFTGVFSAPTPEAAALEPRALLKTAIVSNLTAVALPYLISINKTAETVTPASSPAAIAAAEVVYKTDITAVVGAIKYATTQSKGALTVRDIDSSIMSRQATVPLGVLLGELIADVLAAVDALLASLGLGPASGLLAPLGPALSALLIALELVVDDLLAAVETLVNDLLTGLAGGLLLA